jgi:hypothetical protein
MTLPHNAAAGNGPAVRQPTLFHAAAYGDVCPVDPCANKHGGAETSVQAHERVKRHKRAIHEKIIALARARGQEGVTVHELAAELQTYPSSISGRLTELRSVLGRLTYKLDAAGRRVKRRGACVLVLTEE